MNELALFAGGGGGLLGSHLLGWNPVAAVELRAYRRKVLLQRQREGCLPRFPLWDDVSTFDGRPWRGLVDIVTGGFPCQDLSIAGKKAGIEGARSGLWSEMARIAGEVRPRYVWVENSPQLVRRGLALVLGDLAQMGYDAVWGVVGAAHAGAPHLRERAWVLAYPDPERLEEFEFPPVPEGPGLDHRLPALRVPDPDSFGRKEGRGDPDGEEATQLEDRGDPERPLPCDWWVSQPAPPPVAYGVASRMDQLAATGDGQVPAVVRIAWNILSRSAGIARDVIPPVPGSGDLL